MVTKSSLLIITDRGSCSPNTHVLLITTSQGNSDFRWPSQTRSFAATQLLPIFTTRLSKGMLSKSPHHQVTTVVKAQISPDPRFRVQTHNISTHNTPSCTLDCSRYSLPHWALCFLLAAGTTRTACAQLAACLPWLGQCLQGRTLHSTLQQKL